MAPARIDRQKSPSAGVAGCPAFPMVSCHRIRLAANAIVTITQSLSLCRRKRQRVVVMTPTGQRDSKPVPSQEDRLLDLLRKAEGYAYALAHGYDIGGQPDRAYALVALGERLRDTATDLSDLARPIEPHSAAPASGLRWRAFSLRRTPERNRVAGFKRGASGTTAGQ